MLKAILIDDEINALDALAFELQAYCPDVSVVAKCHSGKEGLVAISKWGPDAVFLDIDMPWMSGFEMLEQLEEINFDVIFVTAYDQYAVSAFDYSAVDYLLNRSPKTNSSGLWIKSCAINNINCRIDNLRSS